jgi:hypothetical protein
VAKCNARTPFYGARAADVVALGVNAATSASSGPGTSTSATWMRPLLVRELRRIATVPFGWVVSTSLVAFRGNGPALALYSRPSGFVGVGLPLVPH